MGGAAWAQDVWDGGGADDDWTTDDNWADDTAPNPAAAGDLEFDGNVRLTPNVDVDFEGITSLTFNVGADAFTIAGGSLSFTGGAAITNDSANTQTINSNLVISDTGLMISAAAGGFNLGGMIDNGGELLAVTGAEDVAIAGDISGAGGLTKDGAGKLTLSGANTFTGDLTIDGGEVALEGGAALDDAVAVLLADAVGVKLTLGASETIGSLAGGGAAGGEVDLGNHTLTVGDATDTEFAGVISGTGSLAKVGAGKLTLSGDNTFSGGVSIDGGTLGLAHDHAAGTGDITVLGSTIDYADGVDIGNAVDLQADATLNVDAGAATQSGAIGETGGSFGVTKIGAGKLTLSGANTFTGDVNVNEGELALAGGAALADTTAVIMADMAGALLSLDNDERIGSLAGGGVSGGDVDLGNHTLTVGDANNTQFAGVISGTGGVTKVGAGTLELSGENTFLGQVQINEGEVALSGGSALADTASVILADMAGALLTLNDDQTIGSLSGGGAAGGNVELHDKTLTVGTAADTEFAGVISGTGGVTKVGAGTLTLTGVNTFTGDMIVNAGVLALSGSIAGNLQNFSVLLGTGSVGGNLTNKTGGFIAPGASIGTLSVGGNYVQEINATLVVEASKAGGGVISNDKLNIVGSATLANGSVIHVVNLGGGGTFAPGDKLVVIMTGGGVTDNGVEVSLDAFSPFLIFTPNINGNDLELIAASAGTFAGKATGRNNRAIARALDADAPTATGAYLGLMSELASLSAADLNFVLNLFSPELYQSLTNATVRATHHHAQTIADYLNYRRIGLLELGLATAGAPTEAPRLASAAMDPAFLAMVIAQAQAAAAGPYVGEGVRVLPIPTPRYNVFASAHRLQHDMDVMIDGTEYQSETIGGQAGIDLDILPSLVVGLSGAYSVTDVTIDKNRGEGEVQSLRVGPYASFSHEPFFIDGALTYGFHQNSMKRRLFGATAKADYDAHEFSAYVGGGYNLVTNSCFITPVASIQYTRHEQDSFHERGAGLFNLAMSQRDFESLRSQVGVRITTVIELGGGVLVPEGFLGWAHESMGDDPMRGRFVAGNNRFSITPGLATEDSFVVGAGVSALWNNYFSIFVQYLGEFSADSDFHALSGGLTFRF